MTKKQRLRKKADKLWHLAGQVKWGKFCYCGRVAQPQNHHYFPKGFYSNLRYALDNAVPICFHHHFSRHHKGDPAVNQGIIKLRGKRWLNRLKKKAYTRLKMSFQTIGYYLDVIKKLESLNI